MTSDLPAIGAANRRTVARQSDREAGRAPWSQFRAGPGPGRGGTRPGRDYAPDWTRVRPG